VEVVEAIAPDPASLQGQVMGLEPGQPVYRILVVDDKATNRLLLSQLLQPVGFEVREASNGVEAIALWQSWQPHLIWMDMQMPVMNGSQATQHIKATSQGQDTTIIALTASALEEDRARVMAAGCDGFVRKPFQSGDIFATMQKCLGVRYLYDQSAPIQPWVNREALAETEGWLAHLDTLPSPWLNQLYQALLDGDLEWANDLIGQLKNQDSEQYGAIADHLQQRLHDFEYEQVLQWIASTMDCND
ncbi:MAG: response regulator, partial [Oculatellaceae cyanobacterium Prado106]|nr:response regulator [Oculatellaceae cyanobacterium Prado106]